MKDFHAQSTKQSYHEDIVSSRQATSVYLWYEFIDDYSYQNNNKVGIYIYPHNDKINIIFFMEKGPQDINTLRKFFEWRISGDSNEIGHKGGGNKRNIYGHNSDNTFLFSKLDSGIILYGKTHPNKIYNLTSNPEISENDFRNVVDTSEYIHIPAEKNSEDLPKWYDTLYAKIKTESPIEPNFMIRMELLDNPEEYKDNDKFNELITLIRAKQYKIPIYIKNEIINDIEYNTKYITKDNIDLLGIEDTNKENEQEIELLYKEKSIYIKFNDKFYNVKDREEYIENDLKHWGVIKMFIINQDYINEQLKEFNSNLCKTNQRTHEEFYGIYLQLNDKLVNYKPFTDKPLGQGKNNKINDNKNTNRFRVLFIPGKECSNIDVLNILIKTETIKALTNFTDKSPNKEINTLSMDIYKGGNPFDKIKKNNKRVIPKVKGGCYLVLLGNGLWKYGQVSDYKKINKRFNDHKKNCCKNIKQFTNKNQKEDMCVPFWDCETESPSGIEEKISQLLEKYKDKITIYVSNGNQHKDREYFKCENVQYIIDVIIPELNKLQ